MSFYKGFRGFGLEKKVAFKPLVDGATVPVVRNEALVVPEGFPPPAGLVPSAPDGFAPYTIRPEVIGAPVDKGVVPGVYDERTLMSLFPELTKATSVVKSPVVPPGAKSLLPPSPVEAILNTKAESSVQKAVESDSRAQVQASVATDLQRKADQAAFESTKATTRATMDPTFDVQVAAAAAAQRAANAQLYADEAAKKALVAESKANKDATSARKAVEKQEAAVAQNEMTFEESVAQADWNSIKQVLGTPGEALPPMATQPVQVPGFSVSPVMAAGVLGVVGYLLGGPRGAAVGALLGGGAAYVMGQGQTPQGLNWGENWGQNWQGQAPAHISPTGGGIIGLDVNGQPTTDPFKVVRGNPNYDPNDPLNSWVG